MDHNTSYLNTNYARDKMIESYHREEKELEEKNLADMEENGKRNNKEQNEA